TILPGEIELGEQYGVSRTAVREAVKTLTAKGMVLPRPRIGTRDKQSSVAYQGMALISVLNVVSQTHLVAIAPRWLAEEFAESLD
ncbi:GntR family transcriptional regulator, partial [Salmonella enterica subsp. enterica serovar Lubbock]|nr:GntR family transcriptional regulator [Salmonella enterica subsp. enterica serovar Lubbock]